VRDPRRDALSSLAPLGGRRRAEQRRYEALELLASPSGPSRYVRSCVLLHVVAVDDELPAAPPGYGPVDGHWPADHRLV